MELILALVLFIGLIVVWLFLPGSTSARIDSIPAEMAHEIGTTMQQPA